MCNFSEIGADLGNMCLKRLSLQILYMWQFYMLLMAKITVKAFDSLNLYKDVKCEAEKGDDSGIVACV